MLANLAFRDEAEDFPRMGGIVLKDVIIELEAFVVGVDGIKVLPRGKVKIDVGTYLSGSLWLHKYYSRHYSLNVHNSPS